MWGSIQGSVFTTTEHGIHPTNRQTSRFLSCILYEVVLVPALKALWEQRQSLDDATPGMSQGKKPCSVLPLLLSGPPPRVGYEGLKEPPTCSTFPAVPPGRAEASALPDQYADDTWSASPLSSLIPTPQFRNVSSIWGAPRGVGSKGLRRGLIQIRQGLWRESGGNISRMWHAGFCVSYMNTAFSASTVTSGISVDLSWCPWHDRPDTSRPIYSARRRVGDRLYQKWLSLEFLGSCGCPGSC